MILKSDMYQRGQCPPDFIGYTESARIRVFAPTFPFRQFIRLIRQFFLALFLLVAVALLFRVLYLSLHFYEFPPIPMTNLRNVDLFIWRFDRFGFRGI